MIPTMTGITCRPMSEQDMDFVRQVYISTRLDEVAQTGWTPAQQIAFLTQQFEFQHAHYQEHYADADFLVICKRDDDNGDDERIGRLYITEWETTVRIVDIALLPAYRGQGIGTALLTDILTQAHANELSVSIHVERNNPALSLYERLGFVKTDEHGIYWLMEAPC